MISKVTKSTFMLLVLLLMLAGVTSAFAAPARQAEQDIVDTAVADGRFTTLATALTEAGLIDTLKGPGPFTVFAPTDEAFAKLPAGELDKLLADKEALTNVLLYHVVDGSVPAADVVNLDTANTVAGQALDVTVEGDKVMVNEAQVIQTDVSATNGIIHVIDTVLLPPAEPDAAPAALPATGGSMPANTTFLMAILSLGLVLILGGFALRQYSLRNH